MSDWSKLKEKRFLALARKECLSTATLRDMGELERLTDERNASCLQQTKRKAVGWWCPKCKYLSESKTVKLEFSVCLSVCSCSGSTTRAQKNWQRCYVEVKQ